MTIFLRKKEKKRGKIKIFEYYKNRKNLYINK